MRTQRAGCGAGRAALAVAVTFVALVAAAAACSAPAAAPAGAATEHWAPAGAAVADARREFATIYDELCRAAERRDVSATTRFRARDFTHTSALGVRRGLNPVAAALRDSYANIEDVRLRATLLSAEVGDRATIVAARFTGTLRLAEDPGGPALRVEFIHRDRWVRTEDGWQLRSTAQLLTYLSHLSRDGATVRRDESAAVKRAREELERSYAAMGRAYVTGDFAAYAALLSPDFTCVNLRGGDDPREQFLGDVEAARARVADPETGANVLAVRVDGGGGAVALRRQRTTDGAVAHSRVFRDHWARTDSGWTLEKSELLYEEKSTGDGEPVVTVAAEVGGFCEEPGS